MSSIQLILSDDAQMLGHTQGAYDSEEAKHLASFTDPMPWIITKIMQAWFHMRSLLF